MKVVEFTIAVLYFLVCISIALYFQRKAGKSAASYWGADQGIGWVVNGIAQFSALVSAASFLGFLGLSYRMGWPLTTMAFGVGSALGFVLSMLIVSGPLRRYSQIRQKFTLTNFFSDRFGSLAGVFSTIFILFLFPIYVIPQLMGGGLTGAYLLGIDFQTATILVGVVYVGYVLIGGMLSVTWTDFVQGLLMFIFMVGLSLVAIYHFGGLGKMLPQALATNPTFLSINPKMSPWTYFGISVGVFMFALSSPHLIMRLFTAKNVSQGRASLSLTAGMSLVFHLLGYIGVAGAALILAPKLANVDNTYIVVMDQLFNPVVRGLAIAGILAAIMSTTDAMLLAIGAEVSTNIYKKFLSPGASDKQVIRVGQIVMALVGVITIVLALGQTKSIGIIVGMLVEGTGSTFAVPLIAGLWWKRANNTGGLLSMVGGFAAFAIVYLTKAVPLFAEILVALPVSLILMVLGSLLTAPPAPENVEFIEELHRAS